MIGTGILPILLWYPAMIYLDLAGIGGYEGFASISMMEQHGIWSSRDSHSIIYYVFNGLYFLWCVTLINLPVAFVLIVRKYWGKRNRPYT